MNQNLVITGMVGVFLMVCVLFEAFVIWRFAETRLAPALGHAALASIASVAVLYFIWPVLVRLDIDEDKVFPLLPILVITTILTEAVLLKVLNRNQPWPRIFLVSSVMNVASFAILYTLLLLL